MSAFSPRSVELTADDDTRSFSLLYPVRAHSHWSRLQRVARCLTSPHQQSLLRTSLPHKMMVPSPRCPRHQSPRPSQSKRSASIASRTASSQCVHLPPILHPKLARSTCAFPRLAGTLKIANVSRIMKGAVPATAKISKEAKECVQECVSEFISFITSEAAEKCQMEKRKTIGGEDILYAMVTLGFENYAESLKIHLSKLRQVRTSCSVLLGEMGAGGAGRLEA